MYSEFVATVDTQKLYDGLMDKVLEYARVGGYIHSNRAGIQKAIKNAGYPPPITLAKPINWNTLPGPYPFTEVYVVPVR